MKEILELINWTFIAQIRILHSFGMKISIDNIFDIYVTRYTIIIYALKRDFLFKNAKKL